MNPLPALAACGVECCAWFLAARRLRTVMSGRLGLGYVMCEVALGYAVLGSFVWAEGWAGRGAFARSPGGKVGARIWQGVGIAGVRPASL